jgi:hypothetical protein
MKTNPVEKLVMGGGHLKVLLYYSLQRTHAESLPSQTLVGALTQRDREPDKERDIPTQPLQYFIVGHLYSPFLNLLSHSQLEHCSCL